MTEDSGPFIPHELRPDVGEPSDAPVPGAGAQPEEVARLAREAMAPERRERLGMDPPGGEIEWGATIVPSPDITTQELDGELLILDLASSHYYSLNDIGTMMWGLLCEGATLEAVADTICERYDAPQARVRGDVASLVRDLERKGLISLRAPSPRSQQT